MKLKILQIDEYMERSNNIQRFLVGNAVSDWDWFEDSRMYTEITPIFNRNGRYFDREAKKVWVEYKGRAFKETSIESFLWDFEQLDVQILNQEELQALYILKNAKLLDNKLKKILRVNEDRNSIRQTYINSACGVNSRLRQFKEKHNIVTPKKERSKGILPE